MMGTEVLERLKGRYAGEFFISKYERTGRIHLFMRSEDGLVAHIWTFTRRDLPPEHRRDTVEGVLLALESAMRGSALLAKLDQAVGKARERLKNLRSSVS